MPTEENITFAEARKLGREIYDNMIYKREQAREAEARYWDFLHKYSGDQEKKNLNDKDDVLVMSLARLGIICDRRTCHSYINLLPDEGLDELLETLKEIEEFYRLQSTQEKLPEPKLVKATVGKGYIRPSFPIQPDDDSNRRGEKT